MTFPLKVVTGFCAAVALGACQVETANEAPQEAPQVAAAVAAPAPAPAPSGGLTRLAGFNAPVVSNGGTMESRSGQKTKVIFVGQVTNIDGQLYVCGVRGASGTGTRRFTSALANRMSYFIGNELVLSDMGFFTSVGSLDAIKDAAPTCKPTGRAWSDSFQAMPQSLRMTGGRTFGG